MLCTEQTRRSTFFGPLPPEIRCETIIGNRFYLIAAPEHPFSGQSSVELSASPGSRYLRASLSGHGGFRPEAAGDALFHTGLADGGKLRVGLRRASGWAGDVPLPDDIPAFPAGWHIPLHLSIPDTRLLTLRDDPRPEICTLRKVFAEVYARGKADKSSVRCKNAAVQCTAAFVISEKELTCPAFPLRSCRWWQRPDHTPSAGPMRGRSSRTCPARRRGGQGWAASR